MLPIIIGKKNKKRLGKKKKDAEKKAPKQTTSSPRKPTTSSPSKPKSMKAGPGQVVSSSGSLASDVLGDLKRNARKLSQ